jgi:hypothetical protein
MEHIEEKRGTSKQYNSRVFLSAAINQEPRTKNQETIRKDCYETKRAVIKTQSIQTMNEK